MTKPTQRAMLTTLTCLKGSGVEGVRSKLFPCDQAPGVVQCMARLAQGERKVCRTLPRRFSGSLSTDAEIGTQLRDLEAALQGCDRSKLFLGGPREITCSLV
jgi:hypothetical protein